MKMKSMLLSLAVLLMFQGCGNNKKIEYRVDGSTPQEQYSVVMVPSTSQPGWDCPRDISKEITLPSSSRPFLVQYLYVGLGGTNSIFCMDTYYKFIIADESFRWTVTYDTPTIPDYKILIRDMVKYGGVTEEISETDAYQLVIADTTLFWNNAMEAHAFPYKCDGCSGYKFDENNPNRWCLFKPDENNTGKRFPLPNDCFMSTLRNWYNIPVFACKELVDRITIFADDDFYTQDISFDAVNKMIREKYGLEMIPADRKMTVKTYKVKE